MNQKQQKVSILHYIDSTGKYNQRCIKYLNTKSDMDNKLKLEIIKELKTIVQGLSLMQLNKAVKEAASTLSDASSREELKQAAIQIAQTMNSSNRDKIKERSTPEGHLIVDFSEDKAKCYLFNFGCQSEQLATPKAGNEFLDLCEKIADIAVENDSESLFGLLCSDYDEERIVLDALDDLAVKVNENLIIKDFHKIIKPKGQENNYSFKFYGHPSIDNNRINTVGLFKSEKENKEVFKEKVLQQIAFSNPLCMQIESIPKSIYNKIRSVAKAEAIAKDAKKNKEWSALDEEDQVLKAIMNGAVEELVLLPQSMVADKDYEGTVENYMKTKNITLHSFYRIAI